MDEIVVRVARTIASLPRLRILSRLAARKEVTPTELAEELGTPLNTLSAHLRALTTAGLIQRRRSGALSYCRAASPYSENTLSGKLTEWLRALLKAPVRAVKTLGLPEARDSPTAEQRLHEVIFGAATAFTDLRRLQILRRLAQQGEATVPDLVNELSMSDKAVSRHTAKLARRGYVAARRTGRRDLVYRLRSELTTPIHARMLEIVRATWNAT